MARPTISRGIAELHGRRLLEAAEPGRIRRAGAGRPKVEARDPQALRELQRLLDATTAGDPMSIVKWTTRSIRDLADALHRGHTVTWRTVARMLHDLEYSLPANVKRLEGPQHPDRDVQFRYLNARIRAFHPLASGEMCAAPPPLMSTALELKTAPIFVEEISRDPPHRHCNVTPRGDEAPNTLNLHIVLPGWPDETSCLTRRSVFTLDFNSRQHEERT
jgi:Rhodopirellula transposase DDE domain